MRENFVHVEKNYLDTGQMWGEKEKKEIEKGFGIKKKVFQFAYKRF